MITALDTNVLLDVLIPNTEYADRVLTVLDESVAHGSLAMSETVYAELGTEFPSHEELRRFLADTRIKVVPSAAEALHAAGDAWRRYLRVRRSGQQCPACGTTQQVQCSKCGRALGGRQHMLADFMIGGHAMIHAGRLLTRDRGFYKTYFPKLTIVAP